MAKSLKSGEESGRYRPNVALLLLNKKGELLVCERIGSKGAWQFPQGGVDKGEGMVEALYRETREEIGLQQKDYKLIDVKAGYRYKYPAKVRARKLKKHNSIGQEQTYFLCRLKGGERPIDVNQSTPEFQDYKWIKPEEFQLSWLPRFKKKLYKKVMKDFFSVDLK